MDVGIAMKRQQRNPHHKKLFSTLSVMVSTQSHILSTDKWTPKDIYVPTLEPVNVVSFATKPL